MNTVPLQYEGLNGGMTLVVDRLNHLINKIEWYRCCCQHNGIKKHVWFVFCQFPAASNVPDPNSNDSQTCLKVDKLVDLWKDFHTLMLALRANPEDDTYMSPQTFHHHARNWGMNFRCVTFDEVNFNLNNSQGFRALCKGNQC